MSILETINKVREAEQEADRLIDEARAEEQRKVAEALRRRKELLGEAAATAERQIAEIRARLEQEESGEAGTIDGEAERECRELRALAEKNRAVASAAALELFHSAFSGSRGKP